MPIFEYECNQCEHQFEKLVLDTSAPAPECPACAANDVRKQISAPGFRLAGSCWYETDFKTGKKKNLAGSQPDAD